MDRIRMTFFCLSFCWLKVLFKFEWLLSQNLFFYFFSLWNIMFSRIPAMEDLLCLIFWFLWIKILSQNLHIFARLLAWVCPFISSWVPPLLMFFRQHLHSTAFPRVYLKEAFREQILHFCGYAFRWVLMCISIAYFCVNLVKQNWHPYGFSPVWVLSWVLRFGLWENVFEQYLHL